MNWLIAVVVFINLFFIDLSGWYIDAIENKSEHDVILELHCFDVPSKQYKINLVCEIDSFNKVFVSEIYQKRSRVPLFFPRHYAAPFQNMAQCCPSFFRFYIGNIIVYDCVEGIYPWKGDSLLGIWKQIVKFPGSNQIEYGAVSCVDYADYRDEVPVCGVVEITSDNNLIVRRDYVAKPTRCATRPVHRSISEFSTEKKLNLTL